MSFCCLVSTSRLAMPQPSWARRALVVTIVDVDIRGYRANTDALLRIMTQGFQSDAR